MELSDIAGLPAHPLMVHLPVVLAPLLGLFAIVLVVVPRWRDRFLPVLVVGAVLAFVGALLAAGSGETLEESVRETAALEDHTELGSAARWTTLLFLVVVVAWWLYERYRRRRAEGATEAGWAKVANIGLPVVVVLAALFSSAWMVQTGHTGAKSVWEDVKVGGEGGDGEGEDGLAPLGVVPAPAVSLR